MILHLAFYKFVPVADPAAFAAQLRDSAQGLLGSIVVAEEGINGVVAGSSGDIAAFRQALHADPRFSGMPFKQSECITAPFARLKVHVKPAIVSVGVDAGASMAGQVSPAQWRELLDDPRVVVLDNRNSFEYRLGRFRGAVDPGVTHFRDFPRYVMQHAAQWRAQGRRVAMYCTGGVRCEKTSAWMQSQGLGVLQLEGGVLNYFQCIPDAQRDWEGECFVFDNRIALDTRLRETATTLEQVYSGEPTWRLERARRLDAAC